MAITIRFDFDENLHGNTTNEVARIIVVCARERKSPARGGAKEEALNTSKNLPVLSAVPLFAYWWKMKIRLTA